MELTPLQNATEIMANKVMTLTASIRSIPVNVTLLQLQLQVSACCGCSIVCRAFCGCHATRGVGCRWYAHYYTHTVISSDLLSVVTFVSRSCGWVGLPGFFRASFPSLARMKRL